MDTQPILSLIREEALQAAESARAQALERAKVIREESLRSSARMFESAKEDAAHEAEQARDRLRRLRELEDRKYALSARRELIGKAFDEETLFTIQRFFENNLNVSETSRKLFVHRNTLVYRLEKIKKLTGLDLREFDDAIVFKVALMVKKYLDAKPVKY